MQCFRDSAMLLYESGIHSFLLLSIIPLYECSIICLPIYPVDNLDSFQFSVQFSCSFVSTSLRPHELQHARPPCPSPTPTVHPNSCPSRWWCHPTISSSVIPFLSEKAMAPHSSALAWKIPWTEEPDRLQSMGSLRVGHDWATSLSLFPFMHWRRKWQPTPVFLPGESQGWGSQVGCRLWGRTELDTTEAT